MRRAAALAALVFVWFGLVARAAADGEIGWVRLDDFSSTRTLDDRVGDGSVEVGLRHALDLGVDDKLRFEANFLAELRDKDYRGRLVDAHWQHRGKRLDWRIGQQKVSWGKADGINPTDFFTPRDYSVLQPFDVDQRLSILAVRADLAVTEVHSVSLVVQPVFTPGRLVLPREMQIPTRRPGDSQPQVGARWSSTGENLDWSVCAFHGHLNMPQLSFDPASSGGLPLFQHFPNLDAVGADLAHNFGRWGFRAEGAWLRPRAEAGWQRIRSYGFLVAGVDRGEDEWGVNLQAVGRYTPKAKKRNSGNPLADAADLQNAINFGQQRRVQLGFTSRLSANWFNQTLQAELSAVCYFRPNTAMLRPLVAYALDDSTRVAVGGEYYAGPRESAFGQLKRNRTAFVEYQRFF